MTGLGNRISARTIDEAECVVSVLLAIALAHGLGATNVAWAAFSGYMVMRGHAAETISRGVLRIIGTIAGGLLALATIPTLTASEPLMASAVFVVGTGSLYAALTTKRSYAWLFFGLTFVMIAFDTIGHPTIALQAFVETRMLETVAGTLACVVVSIASTLTLRRRWPAIRAAPLSGVGWDPHAFRHAAQGGVALTLLAAVSAFVEVPALAQGAVTIMAVMLVPVSSLAASSLPQVSRRIFERFVGCIAGAGLAAVFLFVAQGSAAILILGTIVGVATGRHLENGNHSRRYVGTQFTLAILVTLVPDSYARAAIMPGLERLSGILIGMALLEPVLLAWHLVSPINTRSRSIDASSNETGSI